MKTITRDILDFQEKDFFFAVRDKLDYAKLVINASKSLLLNIDSTGCKCQSNFKLIIDKMSRLFFYKKDKMFSVTFPFQIINNNNEIIEIKTFSGENVDHKNISEINSILENQHFKLNPSITKYKNHSETLDSSGITILEEILLSEPAYVRYDYDPVNLNGRIHPLHHIDLNYSSYGTFKLGLNSEIINNDFDDLFNIRTECHYLE